MESELNGVVRVHRNLGQNLRGSAFAEQSHSAIDGDTNAINHILERLVVQFCADVGMHFAVHAPHHHTRLYPLNSETARTLALQDRLGERSFESILGGGDLVDLEVDGLVHFCIFGIFGVDGVCFQVALVCRVAVPPNHAHCLQPVPVQSQPH